LDNYEGVRADSVNKQVATDQASDESAAENLTIRQWLRQNARMLIFLVALVVIIQLKFDLYLETWWSLAKAAIGLGLVIFIHELGHFLVAKWCDVHVTMFSIGFGPALWRFKRGETTYKLALLPLGGYVQMVGQVDGHEESDGSEDDPRSYKNKTVWQRMAIISAGVVMNILLAIVCFIVVFMGPGKDRTAAIVNIVQSGSPAFVQGLPTGAVITRIGNVENPYFDDLKRVVLASQKGERIPLTYQVAGQTPVTIEIEPRKGSDDTTPLIGIVPADRLMLKEQRYFPRDMTAPVAPHGAASQARPGFAFGDIIVATTDPQDPKKITELPPDPRNPGAGLKDYFAFSRRMQELAGQEVTIRVLRKSHGKEQTVDVVVPPAFHQVLGARMQMGQITAVRQGSTGQQAGIQVRDPDRSVNGDIIERVELPEPEGKPTTYDKATNLDPLRLPFQLRQWAERWSKSGKATPEIRLHVLRHNPDKRQQDERKELLVAWDPHWRFDQEMPYGGSSPQPIPELGIAYQVKTTVVADEEGTGPDRLLKDDVIKAVKLTYYKGETGETKEMPWSDPLEPDEWAGMALNFQSSQLARKVMVRVERNLEGKQETREFAVNLQEDKSWPLAKRGMELSPDIRIQKADSLPSAVGMGLRETYTLEIQVFQHLRGMFTGRISVKAIGGPVLIGMAAFNIAGFDFWEFVFFLGMIGVNLAVINFLPIPVLDGGHMVFLIYEKLRGKPASENVRVAATYVGLLLIATVFVFVMYLDLPRLWHMLTSG
jgi:regulator of sigma E protease